MREKKEVNETEEKVFFDRKQILKIEDIEIVEHYVEQWKSHVLIKVMTSKERQKFQAQIRSKKSGAEDTVPENLMETLIVMSVVDPDNRTAPMFTMPDIALLSEKNSQALASIFAKSAEVNGLTTGAIDKAAKN